MTRYYSPSTNGFYISDIEYASIPSDIVEITEEQHDEMLHELNVNSKIAVFNGGNLSYIDQPVVVTWDTIRARRDRLLANSDYTQSPDWPGSGTLWAAYREKLRDLPQTYSTPEDVIFPTPPGA